MDTASFSVPEISRSFDLTLEGLGLLMQWRFAGSFRALVVSKEGVDAPEREFDLVAEPRLLRYRITERDTGRVSSFDGATGEIVSVDEPCYYGPNVIGFEPMEVRLAFPSNLGIWGNIPGNYRIVGAREVAVGEYAEDPNIEVGDIELLLVLLKADEYKGSLIVSRRQRAAVRLDTPIQTIWYRSIEPL